MLMKHVMYEPHLGRPAWGLGEGVGEGEVGEEEVGKERWRVSDK